VGQRCLRRAADGSPIGSRVHSFRIQIANQLDFLSLGQAEDDGSQGRVGFLQDHEEIFLGNGAVRWMDQAPPAPNRLLNLNAVLVAFDHGVNQLIDLALNSLVGDRDLLWHCPPPVQSLIAIRGPNVSLRNV